MPIAFSSGHFRANFYRVTQLIPGWNRHLHLEDLVAEPRKSCSETAPELFWSGPLEYATRKWQWKSRWQHLPEGAAPSVSATLNPHSVQWIGRNWWVTGCQNSFEVEVQSQVDSNQLLLSKLSDNFITDLSLMRRKRKTVIRWNLLSYRFTETLSLLTRHFHSELPYWNGGGGPRDDVTVSLSTLTFSFFNGLFQGAHPNSILTHFILSFFW